MFADCLFGLVFVAELQLLHAVTESLRQPGPFKHLAYIIDASHAAVIIHQQFVHGASLLDERLD